MNNMCSSLRRRHRHTHVRPDLHRRPPRMSLALPSCDCRSLCSCSSAFVRCNDNAKRLRYKHNCGATLHCHHHWNKVHAPHAAPSDCVAVQPTPGGRYYMGHAMAPASPFLSASRWIAETTRVPSHTSARTQSHTQEHTRTCTCHSTRPVKSPVATNKEFRAFRRLLASPASGVCGSPSCS